LVGRMALDQADTIHGREDLLDYWRRFWAAWKPGARWEITELQSIGDEQVLASGNVRAAGRTSGIESTAAVFHLWTVREGLIVRFLGCDDRATALSGTG
jgi:hypothetical protein